MDPAMLEGAFDYAFADGLYTQGVVVVRGGTIVAERYEEGRDETSFAASWSVAKSFTSALIGIAIDEGLIEAVDVPMADYFPDWVGTEKEAITLKNVLNMASGLQWDETYDPTGGLSDVIEMVLLEGSQLDFAAGIAYGWEPNTQFNYSSGDTMLLSGVLEQATGMTAEEYGQEKIFGPIGMSPVEWWRDIEGHTLTYCCLDTPSRQFAKFGLLFLHEGMWGDTEIVPSSWVAESILPSDASDEYGYQWWLVGNFEPALPSDLYAAWGHDGQFIYIIPSLDLVVVRNGHYLKHDGDTIADPNLYALYPDDLDRSRGTIAPDGGWDHTAFLTPIIDSIQ